MRNGTTWWELVQPQRPGAAAAARLAAAAGRIPRTGQCMVNDNICLAKGSAGGPPGGETPRRSSDKPELKAHRTPQGRQGAGHSKGGWSTPPPDAPQQGSVRAGGGATPSTEEGAGPAGIYPCQGTPVIAGSLWRLPPPQRRDAHDRKSH